MPIQHRHNLSVKLIAIAVIITTALSYSCGSKSNTADTGDGNRLPDTLVVGTLYSPTSYFLYKGNIMGYNYDLITRFAKDRKIAVRFEVMRSMSAMLDSLNSSKIDVIAYNIPITAEYNERIEHCGVENITYQVLVQPVKKGGKLITDVTELVGKDIYVEKDSKYESRLHNLNDELGGGLKIHSISRDTIMSEDLIEMVADGEIPLTVVDSDIAKLDHTYYSNIDISLEVSFPQRSAWAVRKNAKWLADSIDSWASQTEIKDTARSLFRHYFETDKSIKEAEINMRLLKKGIISQYDDFFRKYAATIGWDWKLLAAQCYVESSFDPKAVSWAGAKGVMQLMPATARRYGLDSNTVEDPESCIKAATRHISGLDKSLTPYISDKTERNKFILAAYNSGIAHIYDAIALAKKFGRNPHIWNGNVSRTLLMKAHPEYYNDPVCKYGYFRGTQTVKYVDEVMRIYHLYKRF